MCHRQDALGTRRAQPPPHQELTVSGGTQTRERGLPGDRGVLEGMGADLGDPLPALLPTCTVATTQL